MAATKNVPKVKLLNAVPMEIRSTLSMLSDDVRFEIILTLLKDGEKSFSDLADLIGIKRNLLSHHLKLLCQAALVKNYYAKKENTDDYSFYDATELSRDFVAKLFCVIEPKKPTDLPSSKQMTGNSEPPKHTLKMTDLGFLK